MKPANRPSRPLAVKPMTPGIPHTARLRAYIAGAALTLGLVGVAARAWGLQISDNARYRELATKQHEVNVDIPAPRGDVLDALGRPLAVSADADSIWANPREIRDVTETAAKLAVLLGVEDAALEAKLGVDRRFVWIARHVKPELARAVRAAKLSGIVVTKEPRRWYPGRSIGGPVIGRADIDGNGLDGIELAMNDQLTGRHGAGNAVRDAKGRRTYADGLAQPEPGATVRLTLDRSIQAMAETALADAVTVHNAKSGTVVVLDVATSHVLAMASYPTYDSNTGEGIAGGARNRPVTDAFEAGSVMKLFTVAAALDAKVVATDTWFDLQGGVLQIGSKKIRDVHHDKTLTTSGIIKRSSNVGAVKVAQRLGREKLHAALTRFGFGARSGIELPGEQVGTLRPPERWREIEFATTSFGYGMTVTPVQLAAALAAIGNGGTYRAPRIVESITAADGHAIALPAAEARQAISAQTAAAVRVMMASVFEGGKDGGTAAGIVVPGFRCGGKTGTANKWDAAARRYADTRYLSSFVGLAPIDKPRLAIVVLVDEPTGGDYYGGKVAGPVFGVVASDALRYLGVPGESLICPPPVPGAVVNPFAVVPAKTCTTPAPLPPRPAKPGATPPAAADTPATVPGVLAMFGADRDRSADAANVMTMFGAGEVPIEDVRDGDEPQVDVPDFRGMSLGRAVDTARAAGVRLDIRGGGRVISQDPPAGPMAAHLRVVVEFSDEDSRALREPAP